MDKNANRCTLMCIRAMAGSHRPVFKYTEKLNIRLHLVLESALEAGRFDAGALPNGVYVVQVWDERGPLVDAGHSTLVILR